ncbi:MAG: hypothetical protein R3C53_09035 [Pirellulaceae bacterium]
MLRPKSWLIIWLLLMGQTALLGQQLPQSAPLLGAVLLKNDRILLGDVEVRGDTYVVQIAEQSSVSLSKSQVAYVGRNLADLYAYKLQSIKKWEVGDHFQMTRWCLTHGLRNEAVLHYGEVAKQAAGHPRVKQLAIEIKLKLLEVPEFRTFVGIEPVAGPPSLVQRSGAKQLGSPTQPGGGSDVVSASGTLSADTLQMNVVQHPQIVQQFSSRVQPILINRCSQAACHGSQGSNALRLVAPFGRSSNELSSQNLASVLEQISPTSDQLSPLLAYATTAHGLQRKPGIEVTESTLITELRNWIGFVQNPVVTAEANSATQVQTQLASGLRGVAAPGTPGGTSDSELTRVDPGIASLKRVPRPATDPPQPPAYLPKVAGFPPGESPPSLSELDELERQINEVAPSSNDPFDPAAFNRQMQPKQ